MTVFNPLFDENFLLSVWYDEYQAFKASPDAPALEKRLRLWADREALSETQSEAAFIVMNSRKNKNADIPPMRKLVVCSKS